MSNHFHMVLSTPHSNLGHVMRDFLTSVAKNALWNSTRTNHIFGSRYKWSVLDTAYAVAYVSKYVLRNPVRAGITSTVEAYPYSSLYLPPLSPQIPLVCAIEPLWKFFPRQRADLLTWLNLPTEKESEEQIRLGLRRSHFQFSRDSNNQKFIRDLKECYGVMLE